MTGTDSGAAPEMQQPTEPMEPTQPTQPPPAAWTPPPVTEPGPMPGLRYAGFWVRTISYIVDAIILGVIAGALSPLTGGMTVTAVDGNFDVSYGAAGLQTLIGLVYFVAFWMWRGQTPGMIIFNMRVVRAADGGTIDIGRALLRYVGLIISFIVLLLGVIWVAFDARKQGWHDKMAGTFVVRPV